MRILRAIRRQRLVNRAYGNGYEQGRFDERMDICTGRIPCPCDRCPECHPLAEETPHR